MFRLSSKMLLPFQRGIDEVLTILFSELAVVPQEEKNEISTV